MCKPRTLLVRKSGDRIHWACDAGLSQCSPRLPGAVVSSSGNHPTSLFCFFSPNFFLQLPQRSLIPKSCISQLPVTAMPATNLLVLSWWHEERRQLCACRECQSWSDLWDCTAVLPPNRCSCHHLTAVRNCPSLCTVYTAHTNLPCAQGRFKPFPFLCLLFASLLGSHDLLDISFHQLSSQLFHHKVSVVSAEAEDHVWIS